MVSLQYVLEEGNRDGWLESPLIAFLGVVAAVCLITFVVHELETEHPVVDFTIFGDRTYAAATGLNFLIGTALFAGAFLFSLYCGTIMHYQAVDIGLLFLQGSWIQLLIMPAVGRLIGKVDSRLMIAVGLCGMFVSLWLNGHLNTTADHHAMLMPIFVRACSLGLCFVPLSVVALSNLSPRQRGSGAGLFNLTRELGGSIGTAWMSTYLSNSQKQNFSDLTSRVDVYNPLAAEQLRQAQGTIGLRLLDGERGAQALMSLRLAGQSLLRAFNQSFVLLAGCFVLALLLVLVLRKEEKGAKVDPAAH
jgi:DHA2 family multidrug resistance protein